MPHLLPPRAKVEAPAPQLVSNKPLTNKERKKLTADAPDKVRHFLEDVEPIITDVERDTLLKLSEDYQRDRFVEEFWKRRSVSADGMRTPFRDIYEMRLQEAKQRFHSINTDQGRIFLLHGPPDGIRKIDCQDIYWPIQIWYYERIEELRMSKVLLLFYQQLGVGDYRMWTPLDGQAALIVGNIAGGLNGIGGRRVDVTRCAEYRDVVAAVNTVEANFGVIGGMKMADDLKTAAKPDVEGADRILQMTTDLQTGAAPLPVQRVFRFPELIGSRMRMELAVLLERESLTKKQIGEESFYDVDLVGEVVRDGRLIDNFRYRFDFPASAWRPSYLTSSASSTQALPAASRCRTRTATRPRSSRTSEGPGCSANGESARRGPSQSWRTRARRRAASRSSRSRARSRRGSSASRRGRARMTSPSRSSISTTRGW